MFLQPLKLTVDELLLLLRADADQVRVQLLTALLSLRPGVSLRKVEVTVSHELQPAVGTSLHTYTKKITTSKTCDQELSKSYRLWVQRGNFEG